MAGVVVSWIGCGMSGDNVVVLPVVTRLDASPERVLQAAIDAGLTGAVVLGWDADGNEYFSSSMADGGEVNWLLDRCKHKILSGVDSEDNDA